MNSGSKKKSAYLFFLIFFTWFFLDLFGSYYWFRQSPSLFRGLLLCIFTFGGLGLFLAYLWHPIPLPQNDTVTNRRSKRESTQTIKLIAVLCGIATAALLLMLVFWPERLFEIRDATKTIHGNLPSQPLGRGVTIESITLYYALYGIVVGLLYVFIFTHVSEFSIEYFKVKSLGTPLEKIGLGIRSVGYAFMSFGMVAFPILILSFIRDDLSQQRYKAIYYYFGALLVTILLNIPILQKASKSYKTKYIIKCTECRRENERPHFEGQVGKSVYTFTAEVRAGQLYCWNCNAKLPG
jgi:hypothetical protein